MAQSTQIFLSHSHEDNAWCRDFVGALRQGGADVWYDEHNLGHGGLRDAIERELLARPIFLVALSPAAVVSQWVRSEVDAAIDLQYAQPERIILPVVVDTCELPLFWRRYKRVSGPGNTGVRATEAAAQVARTLALGSVSPASPDMYGTAAGAGDFAAAIDKAPDTYRDTLWQLCTWAVGLQRQRLANLYTYHGKLGGLTLLPYLPNDNAGLVSIYNDKGAYVQFWRSVFMRHAPQSVPAIERIIAPTPVGRGNWTASISDELLVALTAAYREAASSMVRSEAADGAT
jgi:TIR domain